MNAPYPYVDVPSSPKNTVWVVPIIRQGINPLDQGPLGGFKAEVVLEPDNPHDKRAIALRYNDFTLGYVPRSETGKFWRHFARVTASGFIPRVDAAIVVDPDIGERVMVARLRTDEKTCEGVRGLVPKARKYDLPDTYQKRHPYLDRPAPKRTLWQKLIGK